MAYIQRDWDSPHKGLLTGDKLAFQLRRLGSEYLERNARKLEVTKFFLARLNPAALFVFKAGRVCLMKRPVLTTRLPSLIISSYACFIFV
ncbi:hypothetical protein [Neptunomonas phycophila]|uniref:Tc toxin subunit A-related protein n=1 Tax=Neptunomonas phycophila TaxID=1572645 RepID=UPI000948A814|nr:hypothetical protein [Neptunomonas phycophila]